MATFARDHHDGNGNGNGSHSDSGQPRDARKTITPVLVEEQARVTSSSDEASPAAPIRQFRSAKEDRTAKLVIGVFGVLVVAVLMLIGLSEKGKPRVQRPRDSVAARARQAPPTDQSETAAAAIVPGGSMQSVPEESKPSGAISAKDVENTKKARNGAEQADASATGTTGKSLGQIPQFGTEPVNDGWTPPPYGSHSEGPVDKAVETAMAKPSLVFVASSTNSDTRGGADQSAGPFLDLGVGSRLSARLASVVTSAVDQPVLALIEYNYERGGQVIVPAGSRAVGKLVQADRSGYVQIRFDHLELPGGASVSIEALATDTNLGPLRGKVTGTQRGKNFAVRALTGVGQMSAMLVGQGSSGLNSAVSETDLMRMQLAQNVGRAGDQEVMRLMLMEHPIVTLPAGVQIYVVFEKRPAAKPSTDSNTMTQ